MRSVPSLGLLEGLFLLAARGEGVRTARGGTRAGREGARAAREGARATREGARAAREGARDQKKRDRSELETTGQPGAKLGVTGSKRLLFSMTPSRPTVPVLVCGPSALQVLAWCCCPRQCGPRLAPWWEVARGAATSRLGSQAVLKNLLRTSKEQSRLMGRFGPGARDPFLKKNS